MYMYVFPVVLRDISQKQLVFDPWRDGRRLILADAY